MKILKDLNQKNIHSTRPGAIRHLSHIIPIGAPANVFVDADKPNLETENL